MTKFVLITFLTFYSPFLVSQELVDIPFSIIENVPTYPGCENMIEKEKKKCFNKKIQTLVAKNFKLKMAKRLKLKKGKNNIYVQFLISKTGEISQISARAPHPKLEKEGIRVVQLIPKVQPGIHRGQEVSVRYILPITFLVE